MSFEVVILATPASALAMVAYCCATRYFGAVDAAGQRCAMSRLMFSLTFGTSVLMFEAVLCEIAGYLRPAARQNALHAALLSLALLIVVVAPALPSSSSACASPRHHA